MAKEVIITARDDPEGYATVRATLPTDALDGDPLYGEFGRRYYPAVYGEELVDSSFAVLSGPASALVECDVLEHAVGRFGMPLRVLVRADTDRACRRVIRAALDRLDVIACSLRAEEIVVADDTSESLGPVGLAALAAGGVPTVQLHAVVDFEHDDATLLRDVRDSYRSLINWGRRELSLRYCNADDPDRGVFDEYRVLHRHVSGRVTRSTASWDVMFDTITRGDGELSLASLDGEVVGGTLVVDGATRAYYASAAYVRERFEHPLAHWPVWNAILRARMRAVRYFDLGEIPVADDAPPKEASIGFFKKGFTNRVEVRRAWRSLVG